MLALAAATASSAQQAPPCAPDEIGTTACKTDKTEYRVIRGTFSPGKTYGIAWDTDGRTRYDYQMINGNGPYGRYAGDDTATFLVRLTDSQMLRKLGAMHRGDAQRYNHQTLEANWSPDETWLIETSQSKWSTDSAGVYRLGPDVASTSFDLMPVCLDAERRGLKSAGRRVDFQKFEHSIHVKLVANDGSVTAVCMMQVPKQDQDFEFLVKIKLTATPKGITAKLGSVKRCPELKDDCALPEVPVE